MDGDEASPREPKRLRPAAPPDAGKDDAGKDTAGKDTAGKDPAEGPAKAAESAQAGLDQPTAPAAKTDEPTKIETKSESDEPAKTETDASAKEHGKAPDKAQSKAPTAEPTEPTEPAAPTRQPEPVDATRTDATKTDATKTDATKTDAAKVDAVPVPRHGFRTRYAHGLRRLPGPRAAARDVAAWARRPIGRLVLPGLLLVAALAAMVSAGVFLVPSTARTTVAAPAGAASPSATVAPSDFASIAPSAPPAIGSFGPTTAVLRRPADALKTWSARLSPKVGVPSVALEAYGYAELVLGRTNPTCGIKWTTLAAIGKVESDHGSANESTLLADGRTLPTIYGAPLNGTNGNMRIPDTDNGLLDADTTWDRAVGPMQFIPSTWESQAVDADNDGMRDPSDVDDAALAAANYLCGSGRKLTDIADWWAAILTYNDVRPYAVQVYETANEYGAKSRT